MSDAKVPVEDFVPSAATVPAAACFEFHIPDRVRDLCLWVDPIQSGVFFAAFNLFFYLTQWGGYTTLALILYLATVHLAVSVLYLTVMATIRRFQEGKKPDDVVHALSLDKDATVAVVSSIVDQLNHLLHAYAEIQACVSVQRSIGSLVGLYVLAKFGSVFNTATLIYMAGVFFFVVPRVLEMGDNKKIVKKQIKVATDTLAGLYKQLHDKLPKEAKVKANKTD